jgi:hypothetical protein
MEIKLYCITTPEDELLAVKLTRSAAQAVAKVFAPAKVVPMRADKVEAVTSVNPSLRNAEN